MFTVVVPPCASRTLSQSFSLVFSFLPTFSVHYFLGFSFVFVEIFSTYPPFTSQLVILPVLMPVLVDFLGQWELADGIHHISSISSVALAYVGSP